MVDLPGAKLVPGEPIPLQYLTANWTGEFSRPPSSMGLIDRDQFSLGTFIEQRPIEIRQLVLEGSPRKSFTFFDDYYGRIHLIPFVVNLEWVTTITTAPVILWNAYLEPVTLTAISEFNGEGVSLQNLTVPSTYKPLQFHTFNVVAQPDGPPQIATTYTLTFEGFMSVRLRVTGTRATLWEFPPNWADGVDIQYQYKTEISTSRSGKEQRRALRQTARRTISFEALAPDDRFQSFVRLMAGRQQRSFVVPEYTRFTRLAQNASAGADRISVEVVPNWLKEGDSITLIKGNVVEVQTITSIVDNQLIFTGALRQNWKAGEKVTAALSGYMNTQLQAREYTDRLLSIGVEFDVSPGMNIYPVAGDAIETYNGRELFLTRPNWIRPVNVTFESYRQTVDYGHGRVSQFNPVVFTSRYHRATYLGKNSQEVDALAAFYDRMKGQQGEFYMPTWTDDFRPKTEIRTGTSSMRIAGTDFLNDYGRSTIFKSFALFLSDGSMVVRTITNVYEIDDFDGHDTGIEISVAWDRDIKPDEISKGCWLPVWRFASDALNVEWVTDESAQVVMNFRTLEDLEGE